MDQRFVQHVEGALLQLSQSIAAGYQIRLPVKVMGQWKPLRAGNGVPFIVSFGNTLRTERLPAYNGDDATRGHKTCVDSNMCSGHIFIYGKFLPYHYFR
jgi:hypothetical protein